MAPGHMQHALPTRQHCYLHNRSKAQWISGRRRTPHSVTFRLKWPSGAPALKPRNMVVEVWAGAGDKCRSELAPLVWSGTTALMTAACLHNSWCMLNPFK